MGKGKEKSNNDFLRQGFNTSHTQAHTPHILVRISTQQKRLGCKKPHKPFINGKQY